MLIKSSNIFYIFILDYNNKIKNMNYWKNIYIKLAKLSIYEIAIKICTPVKIINESIYLLIIILCFYFYFSY